MEGMVLDSTVVIQVMRDEVVAIVASIVVIYVIWSL